MQHLVSVPRSGGLHPLLCFLHGFDEAAPLALNDALTRWGPLRAGNPASVAARFILLAPQLPYAGDTWQRYADGVRELVETAIERHRADPQRLFLTGGSTSAKSPGHARRRLSKRWA